MEADEARKVLRLIFGVTVRDGRLTDAELAFLDRAMARYGLPAEESVGMPIADPEDAAAALRTLTRAAQAETMGLLIEAAALDGVVHDAERRFLVAAAQAVGWTSEQLEERMVELLSAADES